MADRVPLATPGRIEPIDPSDRIVTAGVVTSGTLTFEDSASGGPRSLASLGGVGGTTGTTDDALLRANGIGGSTAQGSTVTLSDIGFLNNVTQLGIYSNTTVNALQALGGAHTVNGYSRAKFLQIVSSMNAILESSPYSAIDIEVSSSTATGAASISAISVQHNGTLVKANALALAGNMGAIRATAGARVDATQILVDPSAIDRTALLSTGGAGNVAAWQSTSDKVQIGHSAPFSAVTLTFLVQPVAGGLGLTFEYSTGVGTWSSFTAFTIDSIYYTINWPIDELTGWAVGSGGHYWIRFTRTNADAALNSTSLNAVRLMLGGTFYWDEQGRTLQASMQLAKLAANPAVIPANALWLSSADGRMRQGANVLAYLSEIGGGGSGDVVGPASATDEAVARFDLTTGKLIQNSVVAISDTGAVTGVTTLSASGAVTASNVSGTNTGDQTITLTGDVTGSGTGSFAATIAADAVTYAKIQNVSAASRVLGRGSAAGAGDVQELTLGTGLSLSGTTLNATGGDVVGPASSTDNTLPRFDLTTGKLLQGSGVVVDDSNNITGVGALTASGAIAGSNLSGTNTGDQTITLTGDVTGSGTGSFAATIANNAVTYAKMQDVSAASKLLGRGDTGSGDPQEITLGTGLAMSGTTLNATATGIGGTSGVNDNRLIRSDGIGGSTVQSSTITVDDSGNMSGVGTLGTSGAVTIGSGGITVTAGNISMASGATIDSRDVSADGSTLDSHVGSSLIHVPALGTSLQVLRVNAGVTATEWATVSFGGGTIDGSTGATDNRVIRSDGIGGTTVKASAVSIDDSGNVSGVGTLSASGAISGSNLSGTNTGDQTITLTGDVTGSGTGSFAATIATAAVTYAKIQDVSAASRVLGRGSAGGAGDVEELTLGSGLSISATTLSSSATLTGDVTGSGSGSFATTIANDAVTYAKMQNVSAASKVIGRGSAGGAGDPEELSIGSGLAISGTTLSASTTLTGDVTGSGAGSFAATIANDAVTFAKMQNVSAASRLIGRGSSAGSGDPQEISLGSGLSMSGTTLSSTGVTVTYGAGIPSGGSDGDIFYQQPNLLRWVKVSGTWTPQFKEFVGGHNHQSHYSYGMRARYATGTIDVFGGATANTIGTNSGNTYATTNVKTTRTRVTYAPTATANSTCSGVASNACGPFVVSSTLTAGKPIYTCEFALASVTQSNFRFFSGMCSGTTIATDPSTASGHGLGDRVGLVIDANTSLASKWIVNSSNTNLQLDTAYTLVEDYWYMHKVYMVPGSATIYQELWEISSQTSAPALVASTSYASSDFTITSARATCMAANAATASGSGTVNFGQAWVTFFH